MSRKDKILNMISDFFGQHLIVLDYLGKKRDDEALLFMFVFLDTLKEQIMDADQSKIEYLAITAFATMELINEGIIDYCDKKEGMQ